MAEGVIRPCRCGCFFFFNDTATTEIYTLSLHDALPISAIPNVTGSGDRARLFVDSLTSTGGRSEEHTSELQSRSDLVCRLLLEKKKTAIPLILNVFVETSVAKTSDTERCVHTTTQLSTA